MAKRFRILLMIAGGLLLALNVVLCVIMILFLGVNRHEQANAEAILHGRNGKQALVMYQSSRFGVTDRAVDVAIQALHEDGYRVVSNHPRSEIKYQPFEYDIIVLASPVYAGQTAQPLRDFAEKRNFTRKNVLLLLTGANVRETRALKDLRGKVFNAGKIKTVTVTGADEKIAQAVRKLETD